MAAIAALGVEQHFKDLQTIPGWFWPVDMFLFSGIDQLQKMDALTGDILEIGVECTPGTRQSRLASRAGQLMMLGLAHHVLELTGGPIAQR